MRTAADRRAEAARHQQLTEASLKSVPKYQVMSPWCEVLHECNSLAEARRETVEWAAYDDIEVTLMNVFTADEVMTVDGYGDAHARFPRLASKV